MSVNLRKPTLAVLSPGQVTAEYLADGAIDLTTAKVTGELPNSKLGRIDDVEKIKDSLITLAKVQDDVKVDSFVGGEVESEVEGTTEVEIVNSGFTRLPGRFTPNKLRFVGSLKVDGSGNTGYLKVYFDDEVDARLTLSTTSNTFELIDGEIDISDLTNGRHKMLVKIYSSGAGIKVYNDLTEFYFVK